MDFINQELLGQLNSQLTEAIPEFPLDGKFHHFKNGNREPNSSHIWACGFSWEFKGNTYQYVTAGDWRDGSKLTVKSYDSKKISTAERKQAKKHIEEVESQAIKEKEKNHTTCKEKWEAIFKDLPVSSDRHEYLRFKKIDQNYRARIRNSTLLVPIEHPEHGFVGCQQIFKKDEKFLKIFTKGVRIRGSYCRLTNFDIKKESLVYLVEGFATGATVHMATNRPVIVAFNAGNIIPVTSSLKSLNPQLKIIIPGDDDHQNKKNPGKYYASLASKQFSNVIYRLPKFSNPDGLTDFNDLHVCEGLDKVKEQLLINQSDFVSIISLGYNAGKYFYVNTQTSEIFNLTAAQHIQSSLIAQATSKYWGQRFRFKTDKDGNPTSKVDWDHCAEKLLEEQREIGFFDNKNVRGYGAWIDEESVIFNAGKTLYEYKSDDTMIAHEITSHNLNTKFIYEANKPIDFSPNQILSRDELDSIVECFSLASYKNANDHIYILGLLAVAQIPGVCPWRSHEWLTGPRGSGKTTLLSWISQLCYNQGTIQDPTHAGLRQVIGNNSLPVFIDETEPNNPEARRRMDSIMDLARQSSSPNSSRIIRGTTEGNAQSFLVSAIFMLSSIQVSIKNAADLSRFTVIELEKNTRENFAVMKKHAAKFEEYSPKLLAYILSQSHNILANISFIHGFILDEYQDLDARQADQISVLVAGYYSIRHGGLVDEFQLSIIMAQLNIQASDYVEDSREGDESKCLESILDAVDTNSRHTVMQMIQNDFESDLAALGMKVISKNAQCIELFIKAKSNPLKKLIQDTEYEDYAKILRRSEHLVQRKSVQRIFGAPRSGLTVRVVLSDTVQENDLQQYENYDDAPF